MAENQERPKEILRDQAERLEQSPGKAQEAPGAAVVARPVRHYRTLVFQGYAVLAVIAFAVLAVLAHTVTYFPLDLVVTRWLQSYHSAWFNDLMVFISTLGYSPQVYLVSGLMIAVLFFAGLRWEAVMGLITAVGVSTLGGVVKLIVARPRPTSDLVTVLAQLHDNSFPSGHVLFFTAFFGFLLFLAYTLLVHSWARTLVLAILASVIVLMGPSRIYVGQHWFSDVMGAYLLGSVWLLLCLYAYRWGKTRYFVRQPLAREPVRFGQAPQNPSD